MADREIRDPSTPRRDAAALLLPRHDTLSLPIFLLSARTNEGGCKELGRVGPSGWRRSGIALDMKSMGGNGKMEEVPLQGKKTPSFSRRQMASPVRMVLQTLLLDHYSLGE
jgi:hypothetical protein